MTTRLEDYAMIGDGESAALVGKTGSIDWLCWPRFDSDSCFAALVGGESAGYWRISPRQNAARTKWKYREDTLVLEAKIAVDGGTARLVDFMPIRKGPPALVRRVEGISGSVDLQSRLSLRFGYGLVPPWYTCEERRVIGRIGPDLVVLHSDAPTSLDGKDIVADFKVTAGSHVDFILMGGTSTEAAPESLGVDEALAATESYWRKWIGAFDKPTDWPRELRRSLLTLKALINRPTGGIVAAPTTSLPEIPGADMNWDYRFCWLRDATFALAALLNAGYREEAQAWRDWVLRAIAGSPEHIQIMYRIDGGRLITEWTPEWLRGYDWSTPVRIGNAASGQRQVDVYGELIDLLSLAQRAGIDGSQHAFEIQKAIVENLETMWHQPGHGLWESRGKPRHFVYSKVMAWVAVDRFLKYSAHSAMVDDSMRARLEALKHLIHREVCDEGYHPGLGSFVQYYGGEDLDAAALLMPAVGFISANDERMISTTKRIEQELIDDGMLYRSTQSRDNGQGAFLACSGWLADCYLAQGRAADARRTFERLLSVRSELGLLSEEYNIRGRRLCGNFPQALSHLALVTTAVGLCGPVLQRGAG